MSKPTLVVLAAGMGSRYGGLKQMDPVGKSGEFIIDYSVYDAVKAGFGKVVFIINRRIEESFKETIGARLADFVDISYAYQELDLLPEGVSKPEGRTKPYGTAHALYAAGELIDGPFAVINADDYYGRDAFEKMYDFLMTSEAGAFGMVGYLLKNTVSDFGYVSRGVCSVKAGFLMEVEEKVRIEKVNEGIAYFEDDRWQGLDDDTVVSMNMWGADRTLVAYIESQLKDKLVQGLAENPEKFEYYLPFAIDEMLQEGLCSVRCMVTDEVWYGITYEADKAHVVEAIQGMVSKRKYPPSLWEPEMNSLRSVCGQFDFEGEFVSAEPYGDGHINDTYKVAYDRSGEEIFYILQRVNGSIFKEPEKLMENIVNVTEYLADTIRHEKPVGAYEVLEVIKTKDGGSYLKEEEDLYRAYVFVMNATGHLYAKNSQMLVEAGKAFGKMQRLLDGFPVARLHETIRDFHHTVKRYEAFIASCEEDIAGRVNECTEEIAFVLDRKGMLAMIVDGLSKGEIPVRVTHNDTKMNNVLLDNETFEGRCVIDLDTVMPGSALYDYGDAIRSCGSTLEEDSEELESMDLDLERFEAYTRGYLSSVGSTLTDRELELLPYGALIMTLECGIRFLTDHLDGDRYFKTHKENHNLIRCRNQFAYVAVMEDRMDEMKAVVDKYRSVEVK